MQTIEGSAESLKRYCFLQDLVKQKRAELKEQLAPMLEEIEKLKGPLISFLENSESSYSYENKIVTIAQTKRKEPINVKFIVKKIPEFFPKQEKVDEFLDFLEENRTIYEAKSITRRAPKKRKKDEDDDDDDDDDDDNEESDDGDNEDDNNNIKT